MNLWDTVYFYMMILYIYMYMYKEKKLKMKDNKKKLVKMIAWFIFEMERLSNLTFARRCNNRMIYKHQEERLLPTASNLWIYV